MIVQKIYPKPGYTLHTELTQDEVERAAHEAEAALFLCHHLINERRSLYHWLSLKYPTLYRLLTDVQQALQLSRRC